MASKSEGIHGSVVNPPPTKASKTAAPTLLADPLGESKLKTIVEERSKSGTTTRIREMDFAGGKIVVYECIAVRQQSGVSIYEVTSSSVCFVPGADMSAKKTRRK